MCPRAARICRTSLCFAIALALAGRSGTAQQLTTEQRAWLQGHARDSSIAGGWARRAAAARQRREALRRAGLLAGVTVADAARQGAALAGTLNVLILAVTYPDFAPPFPVQDLPAALFAHDGPGNTSVAEYFDEVSQGVLHVAGEATPWIVLDSASSYYLPPSEYRWPNRGAHFGEWLSSVFRKADALVDFGRFDNDGPDGVPNSGDDDGVVDLLWIMYGTDCRGEWRSGYLWPGGGSLSYASADPAARGSSIRVGPAVFMNAQRGAVCAPVYSGVLAHETGHAFGLPDLYDYDFSSYGVGYWDLMGYGLYRSESSPAYLGAFSRAALGWITVQDLWAADSTVRVEPTERAHIAFRYQPAGSHEYFLVENRQPIGTDASLPGAGLLVWHIDPSVTTGNDDESHKLVDVEEADGLAHLDRKTNYGDPGDPFPGSAARRRFGPETNPSSRFYTGEPSGLAIEAITLGADASVFGARQPLSVAITKDSLLSGRMGAPYADTLTASFWAGTLSWSQVAGEMPPGLVLEPATGVVSGIPEHAGRFTVTVGLAAEAGSAQRAYTLTIAEPTLAFDAVVARLFGPGGPLTDDELRYLDLLGNHNGRFDVGDVVAWLDATGERSDRTGSRQRRD
jgi:M6 family metalloprotease-like protein